MIDTRGKTLVLYDGVCGLCHRVAKFILPRDRHDRFLFAPLQSRFARAILRRHGRDPDALDTVYVVLDHDGPDERIYGRSRAALQIARVLGGVWKLALVLGILPDFLLDFLYDRVAKVRYRLFGKHDVCTIPSPAERKKFVAMDDLEPEADPATAAAAA